VDADIRLVGSQSPREGRLELKVGGRWGTVCDDHFADVDAGVACSMLGFGYLCMFLLALADSNNYRGK